MVIISPGIIGVRDGVGGGTCPPNLGERIFFGQTSCNIRAVGLFLEEGRTGTLYFLTVFCFSFHVYVEYSFELFRNLFLAAHFINFSYIRFRAKISCPPKLTELLRLCQV